MKRFNTFTLAVASLVFAITVMSGEVAGAETIFTPAGPGQLATLTFPATRGPAGICHNTPTHPYSDRTPKPRLFLYPPRGASAEDQGLLPSPDTLR